MKILFINVVYKKGSTGKIVDNLFEECSKDNETYLIYGRGEKNKLDRVYKCTFELESKIHHFISKISGNMYGGMFFSTRRIIRKIKKINPNVVNLHCLNGYFVNIYKLLKWLAKNNVKTVLTAHADFMMTGGCGYTVDCQKHVSGECKKCNVVKQFNGKLSLNRTHHFYKALKKSLSNFDVNKFKVVCVSPWLRDRYAQSPIYKRYSVSSILNPVDDVFFTKSSENPYKSKNNVLYVTPDINDLIKAGWLIDDLALSRKDLNFTVICTKNIEHNFKANNVKYIKGGVNKELLRDYYSYADGTVILSLRETFSMIVAESLSCGTPVYGFECGGPETIADANNSIFLDGRDINELSNVLLTIDEDKGKIKKAAFKAYNKTSIAKEYLEVFKF